MLAADREGRIEDALALAQRAVALAEPVHASGPAALGHGELAWLALVRQDFACAQQHIEQGLHWARLCMQLPWREGGATGYLHQIHIIGIEVLLQQARWYQAGQAVTQAQLDLPAQRWRERLSLLLQRARIDTHLGDFDSARAHLDQAAAWAAEFQIDRLRADVANARAELAEHEHAGDMVQQAAEQAERWSRRVAHRTGLASALAHQGTAAWWRGERNAARQRWQDALALYEELESPVNLLEVRCSLALLDHEEGRIDAAWAALQDLLSAAQGGAQASPGSADPNPGATTGPRWPLLTPATLLQCQQLAAGHAALLAAALRAELQRRLQQQLQSLPDEAARQRLAQAVPHWREVAAWPADGHTPGGAHGLPTT
jgi:hypothetical protein